MNLWSLEFWCVQVLLAFLVNLAAAYSKSPLDRIFERQFASIRTQREKYHQKAVWLSTRPLMVVHMMHEESRLRGQSVLYLIAALMLAVFARGIGKEPVSWLLASMAAGSAVIGFISNVRAGHREMLVAKAVGLSAFS